MYFFCHLFVCTADRGRQGAAAVVFFFKIVLSFVFFALQIEDGKGPQQFYLVHLHTLTRLAAEQVREFFFNLQFVFVCTMTRLAAQLESRSLNTVLVLLKYGIMFWG